MFEKIMWGCIVVVAGFFVLMVLNVVRIGIVILQDWCRKPSLPADIRPSDVEVRPSCAQVNDADFDPETDYSQSLGPFPVPDAGRLTEVKKQINDQYHQATQGSMRNTTYQGVPVDDFDREYAIKLVVLLQSEKAMHEFDKKIDANLTEQLEGDE